MNKILIKFGKCRKTTTNNVTVEELFCSFSSAKNKGWRTFSFSFIKNKFLEVIITGCTCNPDKILNDVQFVCNFKLLLAEAMKEEVNNIAVKAFGKIGNTNLSLRNVEYISTVSNLEELNTFKNLFTNAVLATEDCSNLHVSLKAHLEKYGSILDGFEDTADNKTTKLIFPYKKEIGETAEEWLKTNNLFSDAYIPAFNADIYVSNKNRDCFKRFCKIADTQYASKNYHLILLHGNPAAGKTAMVELYAAIRGCIYVYIPCNGDTDMQDLLAHPAMITDAQGNTKLETVKTALYYLKKMPKANKAVVLLDEFNLIPSKTATAMNTFFSERKFLCKELNETLSGDTSNVVFVMAINPNTAGGQSLDEKLKDRTSYICVPDIAIETKKSHMAKEYLAMKQQLNAESYTKLVVELEEALAADPTREEEFNIAISNVKQIITGKGFGTYNSVKEYVQDIIDNKKVIVDGEFNSLFEGDIPSTEEVELVFSEVQNFIEDLNDVLYKETFGMDVKSPNPNNYEKVNQRNSSIFIDYILCYRSVAKALEAYIIDMIPGGGTFGVDTDVRNSEPGKKIYDNIVYQMATKVEDLQRVLFSTKTKQECLDEIKNVFDIKSNEFNSENYLTQEELDEEAKAEVEENVPNLSSSTLNVDEFSDEDLSSLESFFNI